MSFSNPISLLELLSLLPEVGVLSPLRVLEPLLLLLLSEPPCDPPLFFVVVAIVCWVLGSELFMIQQLDLTAKSGAVSHPSLEPRGLPR